MVPSPPLDFANFLNHISHCLQVTTAAVRGPVSDVELIHLMRLARLWTTQQRHLSTGSKAVGSRAYFGIEGSKGPESESREFLFSQ